MSDKERHKLVYYLHSNAAWVRSKAHFPHCLAHRSRLGSLRATAQSLYSLQSCGTRRMPLQPCPAREIWWLPPRPPLRPELQRPDVLVRPVIQLAHVSGRIRERIIHLFNNEFSALSIYMGVRSIRKNQQQTSHLVVRFVWLQPPEGCA